MNDFSRVLRTEIMIEYLCHLGDNCLNVVRGVFGNREVKGLLYGYGDVIIHSNVKAGILVTLGRKMIAAALTAPASALFPGLSANDLDNASASEVSVRLDIMLM